MYAKISNCEFWLSDVVFLGHVVSIADIAVVLAKVDTMLRWE